MAVFLSVSFFPKFYLVFISLLFFRLWVCTQFTRVWQGVFTSLVEEGRRFSCTCRKWEKVEEKFTSPSFVQWKVFSNSFVGSAYTGEFCTNLVLLSLSLFFFFNETAQVLVLVRRNVVVLPLPIMETMIKTLEMRYQLEEFLQLFYSLHSGSKIAYVWNIIEGQERTQTEHKVLLKNKLSRLWMQHLLFIKPIDVSFILFSILWRFSSFPDSLFPSLCRHLHFLLSGLSYTLNHSNFGGMLYFAERVPCVSFLTQDFDWN